MFNYRLVLEIIICEIHGFGKTWFFLKKPGFFRNAKKKRVLEAVGIYELYAFHTSLAYMIHAILSRVCREKPESSAVFFSLNALGLS